jgi:hypothetical protein
MTLRILAEAEEEAQEAALWYDARRPGLGDDFLDVLSSAFQASERLPQASSRVPNAPAGREVRRYVLRRFPYTVVYEVRADEVLVLAVAHTRRRPNYWHHRQG